jgi:hypothetical protein
VKSGYILAFALAISLTAQAKAQAVIDDQTACAAAIDALESPDKEKMRPVWAYIEGVFGRLDQRHRESGEPGILVEMNDREASRLMSVAVGLCRQRQDGTVFDAATRAYGAMRAMYDLPSSPNR